MTNNKSLPFGRIRWARSGIVSQSSLESVLQSITKHIFNLTTQFLIGLSRLANCSLTGALSQHDRIMQHKQIHTHRPIDFCMRIDQILGRSDYSTKKKIQQRVIVVQFEKCGPVFVFECSVCEHSSIIKLEERWLAKRKDEKKFITRYKSVYLMKPWLLFNKLLSYSWITNTANWSRNCKIKRER